MLAQLIGYSGHSGRHKHSQTNRMLDLFRPGLARLYETLIFLLCSTIARFFFFNGGRMTGSCRVRSCTLDVSMCLARCDSVSSACDGDLSVHFGQIERATDYWQCTSHQRSTGLQCLRSSDRQTALVKDRESETLTQRLLLPSPPTLPPIGSQNF